MTSSASLPGVFDLTTVDIATNAVPRTPKYGPPASCLIHRLGGPGPEGAVPCLTGPSALRMPKSLGEGGAVVSPLGRCADGPRERPPAGRARAAGAQQLD